LDLGYIPILPEASQSLAGFFAQPDPRAQKKIKTVPTDTLKQPSAAATNLIDLNNASIYF
jgi:hypothetical protein